MNIYVAFTNEQTVEGLCDALGLKPQHFQEIGEGFPGNRAEVPGPKQGENVAYAPRKPGRVRLDPKVHQFRFLNRFLIFPGHVEHHVDSEEVILKVKKGGLHINGRLKALGCEGPEFIRKVEQGEVCREHLTHLLIQKDLTGDCQPLLEEFSDLRELRLESCPDFTSLPHLENLHALRVFDCRGIVNVDGLSALKFLRVFDYYGDCLESVQGLSKACSLTNLSLNAYDLNTYHPLTFLPSLEQLMSLHVGWDLTTSDVEHILSCPTLQELTLTGFPFRDAKGFANLVELQDFALQWAQGLESIQDLHLPETVKDLYITGGSFESLRGIELIDDLQHLELSACKQLSDLRPLQDAVFLESLVLKHCPLVADLHAISEHEFLHTVNLEGSELAISSEALAPLYTLSSLEDLQGPAPHLRVGILLHCAGLRNDLKAQQRLLKEALEVYAACPDPDLGMEIARALSALAEQEISEYLISFMNISASIEAASAALGLQRTSRYLLRSKADWMLVDSSESAGSSSSSRKTG